MTGHDFRLRREDYWSGIIIHHTSVGSKPVADAATWQKLFISIAKYLSKKDDNYVSYHYLISREGECVQIIDPRKYEAFHAGKSRYWCPIRRRVCDDWNRYAIGISLVGDGKMHEYSQEQYEALVSLCKFLINENPSIHPLAIIGHENISPDRKVDPGKLFDWRLFFKKLYA